MRPLMNRRSALSAQVHVPDEKLRSLANWRAAVAGADSGAAYLAFALQLTGH